MILTVSRDGNLVIVDGKVSYHVTSISSDSNTSATLFDTGNLVLRDNTSNILWENFDYPSNQEFSPYCFTLIGFYLARVDKVLD